MNPQVLHNKNPQRLSSGTQPVGLDMNLSYTYPPTGNKANYSPTPFDRVTQYESTQLKFARPYTQNPQINQTHQNKARQYSYPAFNSQVIEPVSTGADNGKFGIRRDEWLHQNKWLNRDDSFDSENSAFFSEETVDIIYRKVVDLLSDLKMYGKKVVVDKKVIRTLMGVIFEQRFDTNRKMIDVCINMAAHQIRTEIEMIQQNENLDIWVTQLAGDPAYYNMRAHSKIKLNHKRASGIDFNMNF